MVCAFWEMALCDGELAFFLAAKLPARPYHPFTLKALSPQHSACERVFHSSTAGRGEVRGMCRVQFAKDGGDGATL